jgi:hypothetical protein
MARMQEIEEAQVTARYEISAGVFHDQRAAEEMLTTLLDRGYEGALLSSERDGLLLFELRVGPFDTLEETEETAELLRDAFELPASVIVRPLPEEP